MTARNSWKFSHEQFCIVECFFPATISTSIAITSHRFYLIKENLSRCLQRILKVFESSEGWAWLKSLSNLHLISDHYQIFKYLKKAQWRRFSCNLHVCEVFLLKFYRMSGNVDNVSKKFDEMRGKIVRMSNINYWNTKMVIEIT